MTPEVGGQDTLRIRYARLREAFQDELTRWSARHVSGLVLPADGATKPLQGQKMDNFVDSICLDDLNVLQQAEGELRGRRGDNSEVPLNRPDTDGDR